MPFEATPAATRPGPHRWLLAALLLLVLFELPGTWLFDQDETRYAEVGREMLATGDWVTPRLDYAHYFEKPPLTYWLNAASLGAFGNNPYAARLPARVAALGTALLLLLLSRGIGPAGTGPWAAVFWLSAPLTLVLSRMNLTDGPLTLFLTAEFLCLRGFLAAPPWSRRSMAWLAGTGVAAGLAVLTKGLVALVLPGLVLLGWAAVTGNWRRVLESLLSPAPVLCLAVAVPWFLRVEEANPGFTHRFIVEEHFTRFTTGDTARNHFFGFPAAVLLAGFLPWLLLLRGPGRALFPLRLARLREDPDGLLLWLWFLSTPLFFALSKSTLAPYVLPSVPAGALLCARAAASADREPSFPGGRRGVGRAAVALAALGFVAVALLPLFVDLHSWHGLAERAGLEKEARVVSYKCHANHLPLLLERKVPVVAHLGELATDGVYPADVFWPITDFWLRWDSGERLVVLVSEDDLQDFAKPGRPPPRVLARNYQRALVANYGEGPR